MKGNAIPSDKRVKISLFPASSFIIAFLVFGAFTTLQMMLIGDYIDYLHLPAKTIVSVVALWVLGAAAFTLLVRRQFLKRYQKPMEIFADAARKVAGGDFSVYVPPRHTPDKLDHLDVILTDFNKMVEELGSIETLKTDFFSNVSHEIKTPIAIIQNYAEALKNEQLPAHKEPTILKQSCRRPCACLR